MLSKRAQSFQNPQNSPVQMYIPVPKSVGTGSDVEKISEVLERPTDAIESYPREIEQIVMRPEMHCYCPHCNYEFPERGGFILDHRVNGYTVWKCNQCGNLFRASKRADIEAADFMSAFKTRAEKGVSKPMKPHTTIRPQVEKPQKVVKPVRPSVTTVGTKLSKRASLENSVRLLLEKLRDLGLPVQEIRYRTNKAFVVLSKDTQISPVEVPRVIDWFKKLPGNTIVEIEIGTKAKGSPFMYDHLVRAYIGPASQSPSSTEYDFAKSTFPDSMNRFVEN